MRIAVQIFGHLRTFSRCAASLRTHLLDRHPEHDVFLHTWDRLEHDTVTHHDCLGAPTLLDDCHRHAVEQLYRPTRMTIGRQTPRDLGLLSFLNGKQMAVSGIAYMFESMRLANQLRETYANESGVQYDVVVTVRPDIELRRPLDLAKYLAYSQPPNVREDETSRIRFAAAGPLPPLVNDLRGFPASDLLFFARPDVMTRILQIADDLWGYDMPATVAPARPRNILNTYCDDIGITTAIVDYLRPADFDIVRP